MTNKPSKPAVIQTLLESGAHFDAVNVEKKAFFNMLKGQPLHEVNKTWATFLFGKVLCSVGILYIFFYKRYSCLTSN